MAHDSIQRSLDLIDQANDALDRCAIHIAQRPPDQPDPFEAWAASAPTTTKEKRVSQSDMIAALARHEVAKSIREADTVTRAELRQRLDDFAEMIGAETGKNERALRDEIAALKAEIAALRSEPLDLPKLKLIGEGR